MSPAQQGVFSMMAATSSCATRHSGVRANVLHLFFSCTGDCPERIYHSQCGMHDDWARWEFSRPQVILSPELTWEGADLPPTTSVVGAADSRLRELRDPGIFVEDGRKSIFFTAVRVKAPSAWCSSMDCNQSSTSGGILFSVFASDATVLSIFLQFIQAE